MTFKLTGLIQDNYGRYHRPGEFVKVIDQLRELGTERTLFRVVWADGTKGIALPSDIVDHPESSHRLEPQV